LGAFFLLASSSVSHYLLTGRPFSAFFADYCFATGFFHIGCAATATLSPPLSMFRRIDADMPPLMLRCSRRFTTLIFFHCCFLSLLRRH